MMLESESEPAEYIWVDRNMKRCNKSSTARHAKYIKEYELYVIDH